MIKTLIFKLINIYFIKRFIKNRVFVINKTISALIYIKKRDFKQSLLISKY